MNIHSILSLKKSIKSLLLGGSLAMVLGGFLLSQNVLLEGNSQTALAHDEGCTITGNELKHAADNGEVEAHVNPQQGTATIVNNTDCTIQFDFAVYKTFIDTSFANQRLDNHTGLVNLAPHSSGSYQVSIPNCTYQIDVMTESAPPTGIHQTPAIYGEIIGSPNGVCTNATPTPTPTPTPSGTPAPFTAICLVNDNVSQVKVGDTVRFRVNAEGGVRPYFITWGGNDPVLASIGDSNQDSASVVFTSTGEKRAVVRVRDQANNEVTLNCPVVIVSTPTPTPSPSVTPTPTPTPTPSPSVTPTPTPPVSPTPTPPSIVCGANQVVQMINSQLTCVTQTTTNTNTNTNSNTAQGGSSTVNITQTTSPAVLAAQIRSGKPVVVSQDKGGAKELPKTGLPLAGVALASLLPIGKKLKGFGKSEQEDMSANSVWMNRQFKA